MASAFTPTVLTISSGGSGGSGSSTTITQANTFAVGDWVYLNGSTYTLAKADSANTASVVGIVSAASGTQFTLNTSGLVTGLSGLTTGADYFLSATTAGLATTTEPTTTGYVSAPVGIAASATSIQVAIKRGVVIGTSNVFTSINLANTSATTIQNIASFANGEGGVLTGVIKIDATTDYVFGFEISFTKDIAGVINHSVRYFAGDVLPGISVTVSGQNIQITLGTLAGFVSATARFQLSASAVSPSLQISSNNITYQEPLSFRNRIINGNMAIDQRRNGTSGYTVTAQSFAADRWFSENSAGGGTLRAEIVANTATSNKKALRLTATAAATSVTGTNYWRGISHTIEGYNVADLVGKDVTISFKFRAQVNGVYPVSINGAVGANSYVTTINYTNADQPQSFSITLNLQASAFTEVGNAQGLYLTIGFVNTGTFQTSTLNAWQVGTKFSSTSDTAWWLTNGNYIEAGDIQLERGTVATPFETRPIGTELVLCQRYYEKSYDLEIAPGTATANGTVVWNGTSTGMCLYVPYKVTKRIASSPPINYSQQTGAANQVRNETAGADVAASINRFSRNGFVAQPVQIVNNQYSLQFSVDAELL